MQKIEFKRAYNLDNSTINICYNGNSEHSIKKQQKKEALLERSVLSLNKNPIDIIRLISIIRTIYNSDEETYLQITIESNNNFQSAAYTNKGFSYYRHDVKDENRSDECTIIYTSLSQVKYNFSTEKQDENTLKRTAQFLKEETELIQRLEKVSPIKLNKTTRSLCKAYKTFYEEDVDFSSSEACIKLQGMASILDHFNCYQLEYFKFDTYREYGKNGLMISSKIDEELIKHLPLEKAIIDITSFSKQNIAKPISVIGMILRENKLNDVDGIIIVNEVLNTLKQFKTTPNEWALADYLEDTYPKEEVKKVYQITKDIRHRIWSLKIGR